MVKNSPNRISFGGSQFSTKRSDGKLVRAPNIFATGPPTPTQTVSCSGASVAVEFEKKSTISSGKLPKSPRQRCANKFMHNVTPTRLDTRDGTSRGAGMGVKKSHRGCSVISMV